MNQRSGNTSTKYEIIIRRSPGNPYTWIVRKSGWIEGEGQEVDEGLAFNMAVVCLLKHRPKLEAQ